MTPEDILKMLGFLLGMVILGFTLQAAAYFTATPQAADAMRRGDCTLLTYMILHRCPEPKGK